MALAQKLRIVDPAEYDRFDDMHRFTARWGKERVAFSISGLAVRIIARRNDRRTGDPKVEFALGGKLLDEAAQRVFERGGCDPNDRYHIDHGDLPPEPTESPVFRR